MISRDPRDAADATSARIPQHRIQVLGRSDFLGLELSVGAAVDPTDFVTEIGRVHPTND